MNNHHRNYNSSKLQDFKSFGCKVLLGQPVLSFAQPFVTVAFRYSPRAEEYRKFLDGGWEPYGVSGTGFLSSGNGEEFVEVTFRRNDPSAKTPIDIV